MLACRLDVQVGYDIVLTVLSAVVAVAFTFAALASPYASETLENSTTVKTFSRWNHGICASVVNLFVGRRTPDLEAGYAPLQTTDAEDRMTVTDDAPADDEADEDDEDNQGSSDEDEPDDGREGRSAAPISAESNQDALSTPGSGPSRLPGTRRRPSFSMSGDGGMPNQSPVRSTRHRLLQRALASAGYSRGSRASTPNSSSTTTSSSDSSSFTRNLSGTTLATSSSSSWGEPLRAGLSRETRLRIKARARERPLPEFGWRYWAKLHYRSISVFLFIRASIWASAIVFMHYCGTCQTHVAHRPTSSPPTTGMWAMKLPAGRIVWDLRIVGLSYVVAFSVCFVGCMFMTHMETHFGQQMAFSAIAALGCCSMHYTGMNHAPLLHGNLTNVIEHRHGRGYILHTCSVHSGCRIPRVLALHDPRHRGRGLRGLERGARARRYRRAEQNGGDDSDEAQTLENHGRKGGS